MRRDWVPPTAMVLVWLGATPAAAQPVPRPLALPLAVERAAVVSVPPDRPAPMPPVHVARPLGDGTPLVYEQFPRILVPGETGTIRLLVEIVGDVPTAVFRRNVPTVAAGYIEEVWTRSATRTVDGRLVSLFDQGYRGSILADLLLYPHGHDLPQVPLGQLEAADPTVTDPVTRVTIWLRLAHSNLPASTVRVITSEESATPVAQYASHVANVVLPGFGDGQVLNGTQAFAFERAAQTFLRYFADSYHTLALIPRRSPLGSYAALNINVKNDVEGIGTPLLDDQAAYGSTVLRSVQLYTAGFAGQQATILHQIGHHWGDETQLAEIAGVTPAGFQPARHTPLLTGGPTLLGGVLDPTRIVERAAGAGQADDTVYRIVRAVPPIMFHQLQRYRMGMLESAAVTDVAVFVDQAQLRSTTPTVGTPVRGALRAVGVNDLMAALGVRRGPTFSRWRVAFVVLSDELISQTEMDYYNFYAQRASADSGTRSYDGYGSFFEATGGRASLHTDIEPLETSVNPTVTETATVSYPPFGPRDWRGLVFDAPVPSRVAAGASLSLSGRIDPEILREKYQFLVLRVMRYGDPPSAATTVQAMVSAGRFAIPLRFISTQAGAHAIDAFVFVDADGPAIPTSVVTPLFVE